MNKEKIQVFTKIINNKKLSLQCIDRLSKQAEFFLNLIAEEQKSFNIMQDNYKIHIGWTIYTIREQQGEFIVLSPDYKRNPFEDTTEDLTISLMVQAQQNEVLKQANVDGSPVSFQDTLVILKDALYSDFIYLERKEVVEENDSGWYIGLLNDRNDSKSVEDYEVLYVYELLALRPELLQLFCLSVGCLAIVSGNTIVEVVDDKNNPIL